MEEGGLARTILRLPPAKDGLFSPPLAGRCEQETPKGATD